MTTGRVRALVGFAAFGAFWGTWGVGLSVALLVLGVCSGGMDAAINAAAVRSESGGARVVSLAHGLFSLTVVVSSLCVAALTRGEGRAWALVVVGIGLMAAAVAAAALPIPRRRPPASSDGTRPSWSWPLILLGVLAAFAYLVENAWQSWGAIQLHDTVGASLRVAALAPAILALAAASGRIGARRLPSRIGPAPLFGVSAALAAAGSALAALSHTTPWVLVGIAVAGLGTSTCAPTLIALAGRPIHGRQGAATGTVITIAYLGFVLGPAAVGLVAGAASLPPPCSGSPPSRWAWPSRARSSLVHNACLLAALPA